jgi:hypothetical protein
MRAIIILAVIVLLMGLVGWITFSDTPGRSSINIETDKIERDAENAAESTGEMLESGARVLTGDKELDEEPINTEPSPTETPITTPVVIP